MVLAAVPYLAANEYVFYVAATACLFAILALAWALPAWFGLFSFGQAAFFGVGAYVSALLAVRAGLSPWLGVAAAGLLGYFSLVPGLSGPSPAAALAGRINAERPAGTSFGVYRMEVNEWVYEVGPPVVSLTDPEDLERFQAAHPSALIVMTQADHEKVGAKRTVVAHAARPKRLRWKSDGSGSLFDRLEQDREDFYLTAGPVPVAR